MMRPLALSTAWMLLGAALFAALFWAFLNTPESTMVMLALSALLVVAMYAVLSVTWSGALIGWQRGWSSGVGLRSAAGVLPFLPAGLFLAGVWWLVGRALGWIDGHSGELLAWLMVTLGWTDARPLLQAVHYIAEWLRVVVAPFAALAWLGDVLTGGWHPAVASTSLRRAFAPTRLALVTVVAGVFVLAPLYFGIYWVPGGLPPTWVEPVFAVAKMSVIALVGAIGCSLIARLAVANRTPAAND
jgi:hypothetical protein